MPSTWITASDLTDPDDPNAPLAVEAASWVLFNLSGQKYPGLMTVTEWYGHRGSSCYSCSFGETFESDTGHIYQPHGHRFYNGSPMGLHTRGKPIISVSSVETLTGVLPSADYQVANRSVIYLTNKTPWNFNGGITVTYEYGQMPPAMGRMAAIDLAEEFLLSINDPAECALPDRVTQVTRLGLSFTMKDPAVLAAMRMTGLASVDLFLSVANPAGAFKKPRVITPDRPRGEKYL